MMEVIIKCSDDCRGNKKINGDPIEEIVRCKNCKHNWSTARNNGIMKPQCDFTNKVLNENDFCSFGERKDD